MTAPTPLMMLLASVLGTALVTGCAPLPTAAPPEQPVVVPESPAQEPTAAPAEPAPEPSSRAWLDAELTDVSTGKSFKLSDFKGRPVLLHAFAVW